MLWLKVAIMSSVLSGNTLGICECETKSNYYKIECVHKHFMQFYSRRHLTFPPRSEFEQLSDFTFYINNNNLIKDVAESLILQQYMLKFFKKHPSLRDKLPVPQFESLAAVFFKI